MRGAAEPPTAAQVGGSKSSFWVLYPDRLCYLCSLQACKEKSDFWFMLYLSTRKVVFNASFSGVFSAHASCSISSMLWHDGASRGQHHTVLTRSAYYWENIVLPRLILELFKWRFSLYYHNSITSIYWFEHINVNDFRFNWKDLFCIGLHVGNHFRKLFLLLFVSSQSVDIGLIQQNWQMQHTTKLNADIKKTYSIKYNGTTENMIFHKTGR